MLEIKNIFVDFDRPILKNISLKAKQGQIIGLVGKSGAGKSTLSLIHISEPTRR